MKGGEPVQHERNRRIDDADEKILAPVSLQVRGKSRRPAIEDEHRPGDQHTGSRRDDRPQRRGKHADEDERATPDRGESDQPRNVGLPHFRRRGAPIAPPARRAPARAARACDRALRRSRSACRPHRRYDDRE